MSFDISNIPPKARAMVVGFVISASTLTGVAVYEDFRPVAYKPVPGDPYTIGMGSTRYEDGKPVKAGDKITPVKALRLLTVTLEGNIATPLKKCITAPLYDYEWSAYITLAYNIGPAAFCKKAAPGQPANLIDLINSQKYEEACKRIDAFNGKYITNAQGKRVKVVIPGLVKRRANERAVCEGKKQEVFQVKHGPSGWGSHLNLDLQWTYRDRGTEPEPWTAGRAFVWERANQYRLLATVYVRNNDYSIYTTGLGGLSKNQRQGLNEYLESLGFTRRHKYDGV